MISFLPTGLTNTRNIALVSQLPETNATNSKLAVYRSRPATQHASTNSSGRKFWWPLCSGNFGFTCHNLYQPSAAIADGMRLFTELLRRSSSFLLGFLHWETHSSQQNSGIIIAMSRGHECDIHTLLTRELVWVDLWKNHLLGPVSYTHLTLPTTLQV